MPTPIGTEHLRAIGAEPRILVHIGNLRLADKGGIILGQEYDPRVKSVSAVSTEWAAGDLGVVSNMAINFNDGDLYMLRVSQAFQLELAGCSVYHYFEGELDKVLVFTGIVVSPINFSDSDRSFRLDVTSALVGTPVGYAPTLEDIPSLAEEGIGKVWPMVYGEPKDSKAVLMSRPVIGRLKDNTPTNSKILRVHNGKAFSQSRPTTANGLTEVPEPIEVKLRIGDEIVLGHFNEDVFRIKQNAYSYEEGSNWIENPRQISHDGWNFDAYSNLRIKTMAEFIDENDTKKFRDPSSNDIFIPQKDGQGRDIDVLGMYAYVRSETNSQEVVSWSKVQSVNWDYDDHQRLKLNSNMSVFLRSGDKISFCSRIRRGWVQRNEEIYIHDAGSHVSIWQSEDPDATKTIYVANSFPTISVGNVYARRSSKHSNSGAEVTDLITLNPSTYEVELAAVDLKINWSGGKKEAIEPCLIKFNVPPLHLMDDPNDPLFLDIKSGVSDNTADALKYLLEEWGGLNINEASFGAAAEKTKFTPANFTRHDIVDVLELAKDIAWQSRSTMIVKLGQFFMKYLPIASITDLVNGVANDVTLVEGSCRVDHTDMSDIITQYVAKWAADGDVRDRNKLNTLTVSNNIDKYGVLSDDVDMFIYDNLKSVQQTLDWWLKQKSVIWNIFSGQAFLDLMAIDPLDYIMVASDLLPVSPVPVRVDSMSFDLQGDAVNFGGWTAIPSGSSNYDAEVISDTISEATEEEESIPEDDKPLPFVKKVGKDQQQSGEDNRAEHGGNSYVAWATVTEDQPDALGKYRCLIYEEGLMAEMDDTTKSTLYASDGSFRQLPLTAVGTQRPENGQQFQLMITPRGFFYYQSTPRYQ